MIERFHATSLQCSKIVTEHYSTSFAAAVKLLHKDIRSDIHSIYGFVRFTDEIVDTFHDFDKAALLQNFKNETFKAIEEKISLNPILNSFQLTINKYAIDHALIEAFFCSMQNDLYENVYDEASYKEYIYGSAETAWTNVLKRFLRRRQSVVYPFKRICMQPWRSFSESEFFARYKS